ncbi:hypothetical protein HU200_039937 [Digitaria exilis]|uniref:Protein kinase domain-containing protein n=1 Tax=Digitaria exilis TaxID=1010633 RepID=A0A835B8F6_9POAL|nr:hypothetical protein HU200_039937 [Digitaria exilis]
MGDQTSEVEDLERIFADTSAAPIKISYAAIKYITKNFAQVIGDGGFGVVYLGSLKKGMVAVKKLFAAKDFSDDQFLDEVTCLKKVNHRNIARFLGYCADTQGEVMEIEGKHRIVEVQQRLLCFEYVPDGNLHHYLKEKTHGYEWNVRFQIIKGICQGLHYIHQEHIYHLDLKPANVLLGANMEPKITDFGVSRCIGEQSTMVTKNFFGTLGYVAPEFIDKQQISLKSDIFSLGVIIINLLTGCHGPVTENWHTAIDVDCPQMRRCIEIAQICVNRDPHNRPTTDEIIHNLKEIETLYHANQTYKPKINEPRDDPRSSLHQIVHRFRALPAGNLREHARYTKVIYFN